MGFHGKKKYAIDNIKNKIVIILLLSYALNILINFFSSFSKVIDDM